MDRLNGVPLDDEVSAWRTKVTISIQRLQDSINQLRDDTREIKEKISGLEDSISGTTESRGLRDRVERLEASHDLLRKVVMTLVTSFVGWLVYYVMSSLFQT